MQIMITGKFCGLARVQPLGSGPRSTRIIYDPVISSSRGLYYIINYIIRGRYYGED
ncbi:MAG: hypothetical protein METHAR1v1_250006 [Methanothrix sp.]|nr:MAG: hypothetical protein METHAR1v1_250006 [Methanothrix sp.]